MSELSLAFKGLWFHFKKFISGVIWVTLNGVLKPVAKRNPQNGTTE